MRRPSLSQPSLKTISVRNLYICERSKLKAELLGQAQLAKNATMTYEKTLQDIRKVFAAMAEGRENEAQILIEQEEKLKLIDDKIASLQIAPAESSNEKEQQ